MLSGIKTGKKKKKPKLESAAAVEAPAAAASTNLSVADRLRQSLASGGNLEDAKPTTSSVLDQLEQRGRIESTTVTGNLSPNVIVQLPAKAVQKKEEDMTVQELVAQERRQNDMTWDEQMTRNMIRLGKNQKRKMRTLENEDSDEEVERMKKWLPGNEATGNEGTKRHTKSLEKAEQRDRHRLLHEKQQEEKVTSKCSWWLESSSFRKHRLLALGNHVSLVMAPPNSSLIAGHHFYLVPLKHAPSMAQVMSDDDGIWKEVEKFQTSLQNLYARKGKSILMLETVLPSKGLWQTKLEVVPVPFDTLQDAPMYFSSSMREQTEEWGTHNKLLKTQCPHKKLSAVVPNKGFPYFYVEWGKLATSPNATGYAQIIESDSFRHDFGLDTVAGMLELDPIRMRKSQNNNEMYEEEQHHIADFLKQWEKVDWTKELDNKTL